MKIQIVQQNSTLGDVGYNKNKILKAVAEARGKADIVVFGELALCGYMPQDQLLEETFLSEMERALHEIIAQTESITVMLGTVIKDKAGLINALLVLRDRTIVQYVQKERLSDVGGYNELRYFVCTIRKENIAERIYDTRGIKIGLILYGDIWDTRRENLYRVLSQKVDLLIDISASVFTYRKQDLRTRYLVNISSLCKTPLIYVNNLGAHTDIIFDGGSCVVDAEQEIMFPCFKEKTFIWDTETVPTIEKSISFLDTVDMLPAELRYMERIYDALIFAIREYFKKQNCKKALLGASGGIDSAVVQALLVAALGKENVFALLMPSRFSSGHSVIDAEKLCKNTEIAYQIIAIERIYDVFLQMLAPNFANLPFSSAEENIQSRIRGVLLMAVANKHGYILVNTSNKSELSMGYGTLYGDLCGGISLLGDVYKTQVYALARYINSIWEVIPQSVLEKAPSAELRPNQKDSDFLPDYPILDKILYQYIECNQDEKWFEKEGYDKGLLDKIFTLLHRNEYKRHQFCPIIKVSERAFGSGRKMPIPSVRK